MCASSRDHHSDNRSCGSGYGYSEPQANGFGVLFKPYKDKIVITFDQNAIYQRPDSKKRRKKRKSKLVK